MNKLENIHNIYFFYRDKQLKIKKYIFKTLRQKYG